MKNLFEEAKPVSRKLKIGMFGPSGSGKTYAALTFPRVAIVDAEGGSDLYAGRPGIPPFLVLRTKTVTDLRAAIQWVRADNGKSLDTLVIDPITVFYEVLKEATARTAKNGEMGFREWAKVNNTMKAVYNDLTSLPVHVIVIARETTEYEGTGNDLKKVGTKADADKSLTYMLDFVLRFNPDHSATVMKSRGSDLGERQRIERVAWGVFEKLATDIEQGRKVEQKSDDEAATAEALALEFQDQDIVTAFFTHWYEKGLTKADLQAALKIDRAIEWKQGRKAADDAVAAWMKAQLDAAEAGNPPSDADVERAFQDVVGRENT